MPTTKNSTVGPSEGPKEKCYHALLFNSKDAEKYGVHYWDCVKCGAVALFNPETVRMLVPRES